MDGLFNARNRLRGARVRRYVDYVGIWSCLLLHVHLDAGFQWISQETHVNKLLFHTCFSLKVF